MKFFIKTLGCKMNFVDSARIRAGLLNAGHQETTEESEAEYYFVNSCTVTHQADRKSRQEGLKAKKRGQKVVLFGCGPKVDSDIWQEQFVDHLVFGKESELLEYFNLSEEDIVFPEGSRTRLPVAIQAGCDNVCSFCITTVARGNHFSLPTEGIIRQVNRAVEHGIQEIILTGINLAAWGSSNSLKYPEEAKLGSLIQEILDQTAIKRIRISSIGPQFIHNEFFEVYKNPRVCDHLHMSIQSGSPEIVKKMNRGHGVKEVYSIVEKARSVRPNTAFTADFIVGFPEETEHHFLETVEMVKTIGFSKLHVFPYSIREGTGAAKMKNQVDPAVKKERAFQLRTLSNQQREQYLDQQIGKTLEFLVDKKKEGLSSNYVSLTFPPKTTLGSLQSVEITPEIRKELS